MQSGIPSWRAPRCRLFVWHRRWASARGVLTVLLTLLALLEGGAAKQERDERLAMCMANKERQAALTKEVQAAIHNNQGGVRAGRRLSAARGEASVASIWKPYNHPEDCSQAMFLLCDGRGGWWTTGFGGRIFFLSRCITKALMLGRVAIMDNNYQPTLEMLKPLAPWSSCTLADVEHARRENAKLLVLPYMAVTSDDMKIVDNIKGPLVPEEYLEHGYFWWKAQELAYVMRPSEGTKRSLEARKKRLQWPGNTTRVVGMQVRRTDKVDGSESKFVNLGKDVKKYKARAVIAEAADTPASQRNLKVFLASDDPKIKGEMLKQSNLQFLPNTPPPMRTIGAFKGRALRDVEDMLLLAETDVLSFTYSSGFGAVAFLLKLVRENFCSNWASLDVGKRDWPKIILVGKGGRQGVSHGTPYNSDLCFVQGFTNKSLEDDPKYTCNMWFTPAPMQHVLSSCKCTK